MICREVFKERLVFFLNRKPLFFKVTMAVFFLYFQHLACNRAPITDPILSMSKSDRNIAMIDDGSRQTFLLTLDAHIKYIDQQPDRILSFGPTQISSKKYLTALVALQTVLQENQNMSLQESVKKYFDVYEIYGRPEGAKGEVFMTSYFSPRFECFSKADAEHPSPVYETPADLVVVDSQSFSGRLQSLGTLRGRIKKGRNGRDVFSAYDKRGDIYQGAVDKLAKIICYADPVEIFILEIQGSGIAVDENGADTYLNYSDQNGWPYSPVGKYMTHLIPLKDMTLDKIEEKLQEMPREEALDLMAKNQSYVFFRESQEPPQTAFGLPAVAERTIASDRNFFPKGTLAFLEFAHPRLDALDKVETWPRTGRFVFDDDVGGAIKGSGRVDFYFGAGPRARILAGQIKQKEAKLYYFVPKSTVP